jgi:glycosyltransferase involved in cell wall biosynthesis
MRPSIRVSDQVICVSHFTRRELEAAFSVDASKIQVTSLAATSPPISNSAALPRQLHDVDYVLFVGTLEPRKNLIGLIQAFADLPTIYSNYRLVIAGQDGWLQQPVKDMLDKYDIADRCLLMGYVDEALLHRLYQQAAVLAMPSLYEGYGLSALEAMQYGTPVVAGNETEIAGLDSPLVHVCQNTSPAAIHCALISAITAGHGQPWIGNSWEDTASKTLDLLESI